jgi:hypothetical protein
MTTLAGNQITLQLDVTSVKGLYIRNQHVLISLESQSLYTCASFENRYRIRGLRGR